MWAHGGALFALVLLAALGGWRASYESAGPALVGYLLPALASVLLIPPLAYRMYALWGAYYRLDRDSLTLHWGLREETIPISEVEWARPASDLTTPLPLPRLRMPGALLGVRIHPDLGAVEFLASEADTLLLLATARRVFAISPESPAKFSAAFQRVMELGSLTPAKPRSMYPSLVVARGWESPLARYFWLSGILLNLGLFVWAGMLIPSTESVALGFSPSLAPLGDFSPASLMLFPSLSAALFALDWLAGLYFYRKEDTRLLAFLVWGVGMLTSALFLLAMNFSIR
jgi:hypothetical protein